MADKKFFDKSRLIADDDLARLAEKVPWQDLFEILTHILVLASAAGREHAKSVDALVSFAGMGEELRELFVIWLYGEDDTRAKRLWLTGQGRHEDFRNPTLEELRGEPYNVPSHKMGGVLIKDWEDHTNGQAVWVAERVEEFGMRSFSVTTSPYHMLRTYLGCLGAFLRNGKSVEEVPLMVPLPAPIAPNREVPYGGYSGWQAIGGEVERIFAYQNLGRIATLSDLQDYLNLHPELWEYDPRIAAAAKLDRGFGLLREEQQNAEG